MTGRQFIATVESFITVVATLRQATWRGRPTPHLTGFTHWAEVVDNAVIGGVRADPPANQSPYFDPPLMSF